MAPLFQQLQLKQDSWSPEYRSALQLDGDLPEDAVAPSALSADIETPVSEWAAHSPACTTEEALQALSPLIFLDGVRRLHLRLLYDFEERLQYAGFGSIAVGALKIEPGQRLSLQNALITPPQVQGYLLIGQSPPDLDLRPFQIPGVPQSFQPVQTRAQPQAQASEVPSQYLQQLMREREQSYLKELQLELSSPGPLFAAQHQEACILVDGPLLKYGARGEHPQFGYIKTLHSQYLPSELNRVVYSLPAATRSPLFALGEGHLSWYQRLRAPKAVEHPLTGIVRLEVKHDHRDEVLRYADLLTRALPQLTLSRLQDPRSPQNLGPVQALERHLKNALGNPALIQRALNHYCQQAQAA